MKNSLVHKNINRVWEIDFLRGFAVALLVFDHLMFAVYGVFGPAWQQNDFAGIKFFEDWYYFANDYWTGSLRGIFGPFFAGVFIFISGVSTTFSKSNLKRGILLMIFSVALSATSYAVMPDEFIHFGVIALLTTAILFWELLNRLCGDNKKALISLELLISISLFITDFMITKNNIPAPSEHCGIFHINWAIETNFNSPGDFFPIFINLAIFLLGSSIGNTLYSSKKSLVPKLNFKVLKPINFLGRHSLLFYIFPQLSFIIILALISLTLITGNMVII